MDFNAKIELVMVAEDLIKAGADLEAAAKPWRVFDGSSTVRAGMKVPAMLTG